MLQHEKLLAGALAYAAELKAKSNHDLKYTRHPLNWLKERGWLDEYPISLRGQTRIAIRQRRLILHSNSAGARPLGMVA